MFRNWFGACTAHRASKADINPAMTHFGSLEAMIWRRAHQLSPTRRDPRCSVEFQLADAVLGLSLLDRRKGHEVTVHVRQIFVDRGRAVQFRSSKFGASHRQPDGPQHVFS